MNKKKLYIIVSLVLAALVAGGLYFYYTDNDGTIEPDMSSLPETPGVPNFTPEE